MATAAVPETSDAATGTSDAAAVPGTGEAAAVPEAATAVPGTGEAAAVPGTGEVAAVPGTSEAAVVYPKKNLSPVEELIEKRARLYKKKIKEADRILEIKAAVNEDQRRKSSTG